MATRPLASSEDGYPAIVASGDERGVYPSGRTGEPEGLIQRHIDLQKDHICGVSPFIKKGICSQLERKRIGTVTGQMLERFEHSGIVRRSARRRKIERISRTYFVTNTAAP